MFFDPAAQLNFASKLAELSIMSATTATIGTASIMSNAFGAAASAYGEAKTKPSSRARKARASKRSSKVESPSYIRPELVDDVVDLTFAPMSVFLGAMSTDGEKEKSPTWPIPPWMFANPFLAEEKKPLFSPVEAFAQFSPLAMMRQMTPSPMAMMNFGPMCAPFAPKAQFPAFPDFFGLSAKSPFDSMPWMQPWMQMMGFKRERTAFEKMADPFDLGSNVIKFPTMAAKATNGSKPASFFSPENFEPAKVAAGMAALVMAPPFMQMTNNSSPWSFFGA